MAAATDGIVIRKLEKGDYDKGFLQLLSQLTTVGDIDERAFTARWQEIDSSPDYHIAVAEDARTHALLGTATILIQLKFVHGCGKVGHIEDVVVDEAARGKRLGLRLIEELVAVAQSRGCYKVILDCAEKNVSFYEKCGLTKKEVQMVKYLDR